KPIWVSESGEIGPNGQLPYVERTWPFLREKIPGIDLIFYYRFATQPPEPAYGLRQGGEVVSDLYLHLRDR
ncbi:MAG: hypothetical protein KDD44_14595, partial [Bdellovibrionales bacterium]|nr:hypothetical protein [Bdellovibrionales bacterium]